MRTLIVSLSSTSGVNKIVCVSMDFHLFGETTVAMIVNCLHDVPILIICLLRYSSPSASVPLSHVSVAMTVVLLTGWYSNCYLLNVNEVLLLC